MERNRVIQTLFTFATSSLKEECRRQVKAINALTAFCCLQKAKRSCRSKSFASDIKFKRDAKLSSVFDPPNLLDFILIKSKSTQCIFCLGEEGLSVVTRLKSFYSLGNLKKHF